ncbi:alternative ribosome rescue aminoacyl-tRNA hydrolase ArfB [Cellulophaga omnivescoria]|uniref:alternative ribosome rescue aminoacyl-tRNA hydrolase ArfB n=1 Tax=Cellulophaga omnivescoria TaxID=1888890 RepID=UPI0022F0A3AC|nr:alternative ribosome rescue aminoacyl-tRNA hydrolase ArfB [Cellulophaga omnivescoria]WBU90521.1 alternative ribosome rescue aminoacyl-tRNA hydrolase ArfB [Cellulophaga omnivescoria]
MDTAQIVQELQFKAVRSSGAGGQHVNKVSTKIELTYDLQNSTAVTDKEKERLLLKLSNRLTKENVLLLQCDDSRSQHKNKELAIKRFLELVKSALIVPKKRKKTKPSRSAIEKRLNTKKKSALKKANRKRPSLD